MAQPVQPVEYGPFREVWFAEVATPGTKYSFLIRDDARSKQGAVFSKTIRLGDPVTLGPNSTWRQTTWEGGNQQEIWQDKAMYLKSTLDVASVRGKAKLWPGYKQVASNNNRANTRYMMCPGPVGFGADTPLFIGENNDNSWVDVTSGTVVPPGGFQVGKYDPNAGTYTALKSDFSASIRFITRINDQGDARNSLLVGTAAGQFWVYDLNANAWFLEANDPNFPAQPNCAVVYGDATYFGQLNLVAKRTWTSPGPAVYSGVKRLTNVRSITGMCVWNNRIWMSASIQGGPNQVLVCDGTNVVPAFNFPGDFLCMDMATHYGSLYFAGWQQGGLGTSGVRGQIWKYNGSSLTKLYEEGTGADGEDHAPFKLASYKQWLAWTRPGVASTNLRPGIMLYDAELDAVVDGPTIGMPVSSSFMQATGLIVWGDTFAVSFKDHTVYSSSFNRPCLIAHVKKTGAVRHTITGFGGNSFAAVAGQTRSDQLTSSVFDGEIAGEQKVWLTARFRLKIPAANSQVVLYVVLDEATTQAIGTINYDSTNTGWRNVTLPLKTASGYLKSTTIQYVIDVLNTDTGNSESTANPEIDSVEIDYMVSPAKRRQWQMRAVCWDNAVRMDGSANPLNTTQTQEDKLEELWSKAVPVLFWDAQTSGGAPGGSGTEVMIKDFNSQSYRQDSQTTAINSEVSLTLIEVV